MHYTETSHYKAAPFKRLVGVTRTTFNLMVCQIREYKLQKRKHPSRGVTAKLSIEDQLLMMLMYYREYRTFFHISSSYGISETQCWRIVTGIEYILLQSELFHLVGKKALHKRENNFELIVIDVSEQPVERPKKNSGPIIRAKRKGTP